MNKQNSDMQKHLNNLYKNPKQIYGYGFGGDPSPKKKSTPKKKK